MGRARPIVVTFLLVAVGTSLLACSPGATPTPLATPIPTPAPATRPPTATTTIPTPPATIPTTVPGQTTPSPPTAAPGCTDQAVFDSHVTVPPETVFSPGQVFVKTWRLRNSGTCAWTTHYALVFVEGDQLGGPPAVPLPNRIEPGSLVDLSVTLTAPAGAGVYEGLWQLRTPQGEFFGVGDNADEPFSVRIVVAATPTITPTATSTPPPPTPSTGTWRGEYYDNPNLAGSPALVRVDSKIDFSWGSSPPAEGLPADLFSVRWTGRHAFEGGTYRFYAFCDDGLRAWLDGDPLIDHWQDAVGVVYSAERSLGSGEHELQLEYYENTYAARVRFWWVRVDDYPRWKGEYFANPNLTGDPVLVRDDAAIDFDWGSGGPAAGLEDEFSARWTRVLTFGGGEYRFRAIVDDGVRLWVDDTLVVDQWQDGARREVIGDATLKAGDHSLRVEYYDRGGQALLQVSWEDVGAYPDWKGQYWSNRDLRGTPALVQNEGTLDFDWGMGSAAAGMPADDFSARWTRVAQFQPGTYRFHVVVDDGARLWVDGKLLIDAWQEGGARELTADLTLAQGSHGLRVDYFEGGGEAMIRVWWEKLP